MRPVRARLGVLLVAAALAAACFQDESDRRAEGPATPTSRATGEGVRPASGAWFRKACAVPERYLERLARGAIVGRSSDVMMIPQAPNSFGTFTVTTHAGPWDFLQRIPIVFYGPGYIAPRGEIALGRETTIADVAPTIAELLGFELPGDRAGRAVTQALEPAGERPGPPKLVMTIVWDGGGWNGLDAWPDAWPFLRRLMNEGTSVAGATIATSPPVTPAIHATLGTGTLPQDHGVVDINIRRGEEVTGAFDGGSPENLELPTLADLYDQATGNRAEMGLIAERNWHLGMMGHGAYLEDGDKDHAALLYESKIEEQADELVTNPDYYELPSYLQGLPGFDEDIRTADLSDGEADGAWLGRSVLGGRIALQLSPAGVLYQTRLLKAMLEREGYGDDGVTDLLFTNFKQIDEVSHVAGTHTEEMRSIIRYTDDALKELVAYLDRTVGKNQWVVIVTADHGQGTSPGVVGGWPISMTELLEDVTAHFGLTRDELIEAQRPSGFWLNHEALARHGVTAEHISNFLLGYRARENLTPDVEIPASYEGRTHERLFQAAFPTAALPEIRSCAARRMKRS